MNEYMVTITFPKDIDDEFMALVPRQRAMVNELMGKGIITSYSLSSNRQTLWVTLVADSEARVLAMIHQMPLFRFMEFEIQELMFHNAPAFARQTFSLN
jgi:muconolactone delta-isomerase